MSKAGGTTTHYLYSADKTKLASRNTSGNGYDYLGSLEYKRTGGSLSLASASFDGGRIVVSDHIAILPDGGGSLPGKGEIEVTPPATGDLSEAQQLGLDLEPDGRPILKPKKIYTPYYYLTDHLGCVRVIVDKAGNVKERNDYYAFGQRWENPSSIVSENKYLFNGKEKQPDFDFLDYGARMYDPGLGRWTSRDLMAEKYLSESLYAFSGNNPIFFVDSNGMSYHYNWETDGYEDEEGNSVPWDMVSSWIQGQHDGGSSSSNMTIYCGVSDGWITVNNGNVFFQRYIGEIMPYEPNIFGQIEEIANESLLGRMLYGMVDDTWITLQSIVRTYPSHLNNNIVRPQEKLAAGVNTLAGLLFRDFGKYLKIPTKTVNAAQFNALYRGTGITGASRDGAAIRQYNYIIKNNSEFNALVPWVDRVNWMFGTWYDQNY